MALQTLPFPARFWAKVYPCPVTGCWLWVGATDPAGYGRAADETGAVRLAHRIAYVLKVGTIPAETPHLDHLCRNQPCVNPDHLEPVTQVENNRRQHEAWLRQTTATNMRRLDEEMSRPSLFDDVDVTTELAVSP